jgi:clan AA aspartic protease (TIGR02281 family)
VAGHLLNLDAGQRRKTELTDETIPSLEEARLLAAELAATIPCHKGFIDAWMAIRPDVVPIMANGFQRLVAARELLIERKITWAEAARREQAIGNEMAESAVATIRGVAPQEQTVSTQPRYEPGSGPAKIGGTDYTQGDPLKSDTAGSAAGMTAVALRQDGGTFTVPVTINDTVTLDFAVDSGAADVSIPADVAMTLIRAGTIDRGDFLGNRTYVLADGSSTPSPTFRIRTLKVGDREVHDVVASIAPVNGTLLLGQSFLRHFASWSIDNHRGVLVLN